MLATSLISGWIGGAVGCGTGYPFDTVKTLMQFDPKAYPTATATVSMLAKEQGLGGFFRGCIVPLTGVGVIFAVGFFTYDVADILLHRWRAEAGLPGRTQSASSFACAADGNATPPFSQLVGDALLCGAFSGVFMSVLEGPAELIKVRHQATLRDHLRAKDATLRSVIAEIHRERGRGARNFTVGTPATLARDVPGSAIWFGVYEAVRYAVCDDYAHPGVAESLLAGGAAGVAMWTAMLPVDVVKTVQQTTHLALGDHRPSFRQVARDIYHRQGVRGFYAGLRPAVMRAFVVNAVTFAARDAVEDVLRHGYRKNG